MNTRHDRSSRDVRRPFVGFRNGRRVASAALGLALLAGTAVSGATAASAATTGQRIDLRVLVVSDGNALEEALVAELSEESIPYTLVDLNSSSRPTITAAYLSGTATTGPEAYYQAVVLPNDTPVGLSAAEMTALVNYETTFGIRQVDSYTWPTAAVGLNTVTGTGATGGFSGTLDGMTAKVTPAGKVSPFSYLAGSVPFENVSTTESESFGYLAIPMANTATTSFTTLLDAPVPGSTKRGALLGVYKNGTREQLVSTLAINQYQQQFQAIAHGMITWMTKGVHLGYDRNYFTIQIDDAFMENARWSTTANCTPGDGCPVGSTVTTPDIRMKPADVTTAVQWSQQTGFRLDFAFNAEGSVEYAEEHNGQDPLKTSFLANKTKFNWINHTYSHMWLGCVQDTSVVPWVCTAPAGVTEWVPQADIESQITQNIAWAQTNGLPINATELVTGEHSGLAWPAQQPVDSPFIGPAFTATGIKVTASDNSRESLPRQVGSAITVPRYPMSVFFNTATKAEAADEYNYMYTSGANGGSDYCVQHPETTTCIAPLNVNTGYANYIVPTETRIDMAHVLGNDPRPHYAHVSNLAEERILYLPLNSIINTYKSLFATNSPIVQPTYTQDSQILTQHTAFAARLAAPGAGQIAAGLTGYILNGKVFVTSTTTGTVPVTAPTGARLNSTTGALFGTAYENEVSAWTSVGTSTPLTIQLAGGVY